MLDEDCYPVEMARNHAYFYLEMPQHGGHGGFYRPGDKETWAERRALEFCQGKLPLIDD